jgi:hypothetical protein
MSLAQLFGFCNWVSIILETHKGSMLMLTLTKYIAQDGKEFPTEKDCARYELASCEGVLEKLKAGIVKHSGSNPKVFWCGGGPCSCMGCVNHKFGEMGFTKAHWDVWVEEYRQELPEVGYLLMAESLRRQ